MKIQSSHFPSIQLLNILFFLLVSLSFGTISFGQNFKRVNIVNNDMLYVSTEDKIYVTTKEGGTNGNSLCVIDPYLGIIEESYFIGNEPNEMAISDDENYLYIGLENIPKIVRFNLATKMVDLTFEIGIDSSSSSPDILYSEDIKAIPGQPNSIIVTRENENSYHADVAVYDMGVLRPNVTNDFFSPSNNILCFIEGNGKIFGYNNQSSSYGITELFIDSSGVFLGDQTQDILAGTNNKIENKNNFIYDEKGKIVDVSDATPSLVGTFMLSGNTTGFLCRAVLEPAPDLDVIYYVYFPSGSGTAYLEIFNQTTFASISYEPIPNAPSISGGNIKDLINWGPDQKLAYNTDSYVGIMRNCTPLFTDTLAINSTGGACFGDTAFVLAPSGYDNYYWSNGIQGNLFSSTIPGYYNVSIMDSLGCTGPSSNNVQIQFAGPSAPPVIQGDFTLCEGEVGQLNAFGASSYIWSTGDSTNHILTDTAGSYWVIGANQYDCQSDTSDLVTVSVLSDSIPNPPMINNLGDSEICNGDSTILAGPNGYSIYLWSNGATTSEIEVTTMNNYYLQVGNHEECLSPYSDAEQILVITLNPPFIQVDGNTIVSSAPSGNQWFFNGQLLPEGILNSFIVPGEEGFYSANVSINGCTSDLSNIINYMIVDIEKIIKENQIIMFPSPSKSTVQLIPKDESIKISTIEIYNLNGSLIKKYDGFNSAPINIDFLSSGIYQMLIFDEDQRILDIEKLIKL